MGLYDEVRIELLFCSYCGAEIRDGLWQTKDGECYMNIYNGLDDIYRKYPEIGFFDLIGHCENCDKYNRIQVLNDSEKHKKLMNEQWNQMRVEWTASALKEHPNHEGHGNIWCPKCPKETDETGD